MTAEQRQTADSVVWFQRRIDKLEAEVSNLLTALVEAKAPSSSTDRPTFSSMGHSRTTQDRCDICGLTGQAFELSRANGPALYCPGNPPQLHTLSGALIDGGDGTCDRQVPADAPFVRTCRNPLPCPEHNDGPECAP